MATTSETLEKAQQLAMEVRIRAGMMVSDYRRSNVVRLRRAHRYAKNLARLAADVCLIYFNNAVKNGKIITTSLTQTMKDKPRGLLRYPNLLRQLQRGYSLTCGNKQIHGIQPFVKRDM